MAKISKKVVNEYRKWVKLHLVLTKTLGFIKTRIEGLELKVLESTQENGSQIVDGFVSEIKTRSGKTGVEYKSAYAEAYKLLSLANQKKMDVFLESVTKAPIATEYVSITDATIAFYTTELKTKDAGDFVELIEGLIE